MPQTAQLILTHGTTDLQILLRDAEGRRWRAAPDKLIVRRFHEWLLEQADGAIVVDLPPDLAEREAEVSFTDWGEDTFALWSQDVKSDARPERDTAGRLQLVLPKIAPAVRDWLKSQSSTTLESTSQRTPMAQALISGGVRHSPLKGALILSTDRGVDEQEPVASFRFIQAWLIQQGVSAEHIREVVFLRPGERLENETSPIDPKIARRIESAVVSFYEPDNKTGLLVASMGGLPAVKPLLAELALLLAGKRAQNLFKTEHGALGLAPTTPVDTLRVRRQCLEQVRRGALLDAWIMASPCHGDRDEQLWLNPLEDAALLINGNPAREGARRPAQQAINRHIGQAACLLVALRVEIALLNQRWLEAINGSLIFLEAAFHDAINGWAANHLENYDARRRYMCFREEAPRILIEKKALQKWIGKDAAPLAYQANTVGADALAAWGEVLQCDPLNELRQVIHEPQQAQGNRFRLADYRNINTHGVMTQDEIDEALKRFMGVNLWSQGVDHPAASPRPGKCFLARPLVTNIIQHLCGDKVDPEAIFRNLLNELEACLIDPSSGLA